MVPFIKLVVDPEEIVAIKQPQAPPELEYEPFIYIFYIVASLESK